MEMQTSDREEEEMKQGKGNGNKKCARIIIHLLSASSEEQQKQNILKKGFPALSSLASQKCHLLSNIHIQRSLIRERIKSAAKRDIETIGTIPSVSLLILLIVTGFSALIVPCSSFPLDSHHGWSPGNHLRSGHRRK